ncbi:MAG: type secretion system protein TssA [Rhodoferax sp.]|nr:type secretion system protein TssA [Rhodoferax sp.]
MLSPISTLEPCGPSLEYDHEFALLLARMEPRADAQYGSFVGTPEAINWTDIERDCQRLLLRTKDINLLVWLCRARTRLGHAIGLAQALGTLSRVLDTWPDAVHPQVMIEGEREPTVRANAMAALADPEGLLADVSDLLVSSSTAMRLTVRDVERAFAVPRAADAMHPDAVARQLGDLRRAAAGDAQSAVHALARAADSAQRIDTWAKGQLADDAPALRPLLRVLNLFVGPTAVSEADPPPSDEAGALTQLLPPVPLVTPHQSRHDMRLTLRAARSWFEANEPSSPVAVLLKQAERMVGKRFSEVADVVPLDLLRRWEADDIGDEGTA